MTINLTEQKLDDETRKKLRQLQRKQTETMIQARAQMQVELEDKLREMGLDLTSPETFNEQVETKFGPGKVLVVVEEKPEFIDAPGGIDVSWKAQLKVVDRAELERQIKDSKGSGFAEDSDAVDGPIDVQPMSEDANAAADE